MAAAEPEENGPAALRTPGVPTADGVTSAMSSKINDSKASVNRPRAVTAGVIFGGVDCYVMEDGAPVLSQSGCVRGLRGNARAGDGDLARYLERLPEKYSALASAPDFEFTLPDGGIAFGRPAHDFVAMCGAYAEMFADGTIHKQRIGLARNAIAILSLLAERGIDEIIYEATGYKKTPPPAPQVIQTVAIENLAVLAKVDALTAMVVQMRHEMGDVQQKLACGNGFVSGCTSPHNANGIKHRLHVMGKRLAECGAVEGVPRARGKQDWHLREVLGFFGPWNRLPLSKEADALRELAAQERAVDMVVEAMNRKRQLELPKLSLAVDNTKKTG